MKHETGIIIIDSGFSAQAIARAGRIVAINDLSTGRAVVSASGVSDEDLAWFAGDKLHHGTIVLERLMDRVPDFPVILVKAMDDAQRSFLRTEWDGSGRISQQGWSEGYRWAVDVCRKLGLRSVANCSFGAFVHASDGTGWEAHQMAFETGPGKPGHVAIVAAGVGDGRPQHASWKQLPGETIVVSAQQWSESRYNFWAGREDGSAQWRLTVKREGDVVYVFDSRAVPPNMWNNRKQQTFVVPGEGIVQLVLELEASGTTDDGINEGALRFDVWAPGDKTACWLDRVDQTLISEPACFPTVIAVGLRRGSYAPDQTVVDAKPEVLLPGGQQISFRIPEVTAEVARMMSESDEPLDVDAVRKRLGKYPELS